MGVCGRYLGYSQVKVAINTVKIYKLNRISLISNIYYLMVTGIRENLKNFYDSRYNGIIADIYE